MNGVETQTVLDGEKKNSFKCFRTQPSQREESMEEVIRKLESLIEKKIEKTESLIISVSLRRLRWKHFPFNHENPINFAART